MSISACVREEQQIQVTQTPLALGTAPGSLELPHVPTPSPLCSFQQVEAGGLQTHRLPGVTWSDVPGPEPRAAVVRGISPAPSRQPDPALGLSQALRKHQLRKSKCKPHFRRTFPQPKGPWFLALGKQLKKRHRCQTQGSKSQLRRNKGWEH